MNLLLINMLITTGLLSILLILILRLFGDKDRNEK